MLSPKRTTFRRHHRGHLRGKASRGNTMVFGDYGLQALEPCWITARQIEAGRRVLTRYVRRTGKLWIRIFQINRLLYVQLEHVWVLVKVTQNIG